MQRFRVIVDTAKQVLERCFFDALGIASERNSDAGKDVPAPQEST